MLETLETNAGFAFNIGKLLLELKLNFHFKSAKYIMSASK